MARAGLHPALEALMRGRIYLLLGLSVVVGAGPAVGQESDETPAKRLIALEAELQRLLGEVRHLKATLPNDEHSLGAEIGAAYEARIGEPMPPEMLKQATADVMALRERLVAQIVDGYVAKGRTLPVRGALAKPLVILQVRSGAGGGNPNRVDMRGALSIYVKERTRRPIPWNAEVSMGEESRAYVMGGAIPSGKAFEVTRVTWRGVAAGDGNGHGEFIVRLGKMVLVERRDDPAVREGGWDGRLLISPGEESSVNVEVANSSHVEARFEGRLIDLADEGTPSK